MTHANLYPVTALVLHSHDYGEVDRLYTLFTREMGKVPAVARGIKKPKAKLAAALQHFTLGEMLLARGRRFDVVAQVHVCNPFYGLRTRLEAVSYASYFAELFTESLEEHQAQPALFDLLVDALTRLARGDAPDLLARYVEISLIAMLGYLPQLTHCVHCQTALATLGSDGRAVWPTWLGFSVAHGGSLCPACLPVVPGAKRIAAGTVQVAQLLLTHGASALADLQLSDRLRREIETTFRDYLEFRLERRLKSVRFLRDWGDQSSPGAVRIATTLHASGA